MGLARTYWIHALTPLHVGSGRGVGFVDLPVMREKVFGWPVIPGSTIKGIMRSYWDTANCGQPSENQPPEESLFNLAFGRAAGDEGHAGALVFSDARLVLLPVRSLYGTFAWVTCPLAMERLSRDLRLAGWTGLLNASFDALGGAQDRVLVARSTCLASRAAGAGEASDKVYLEDLDLNPVPEASPLVEDWASFLSAVLYGPDGQTGWPKLFRQRLAIVGSDVFTYLAETGTEVVARIQMDREKRTVDPHHLWYEENLPAETILAGLVLCEKAYDRESEVEPDGPRSRVEPADLLRVFCSKELRLQVGGKATVGRGLARLLFSYPQTREAKGDSR